MTGVNFDGFPDDGARRGPGRPKKDAVTATLTELAGDQEKGAVGSVPDAGGIDFAKAMENFRLFSETADILPMPPENAIPGFKLIWLSRDAIKDSIANRQAMGYRPVRPDEIPGFQTSEIDSAQNRDVITCREMVLYKLPVELWRQFMNENHYRRPAELLSSTKRDFDEYRRKNGGRNGLGEFGSISGD